MPDRQKDATIKQAFFERFCIVEYCDAHGPGRTAVEADAGLLGEENKSILFRKAWGNLWNQTMIR